MGAQNEEQKLLAVINEIISRNERIVNESRSPSELLQAQEQLKRVLIRLDEINRKAEEEYRNLRRELEDIIRTLVKERRDFESLSAQNAELVKSIENASSKITESLKDYSLALVALNEHVSNLKRCIEELKYGLAIRISDEELRSAIKKSVAEIIHDARSKTIEEVNNALQEFKGTLSLYAVVYAGAIVLAMFLDPIVNFILHVVNKIIGGLR
jgi:chromosome segregation ATPase